MRKTYFGNGYNYGCETMPRPTQFIANPRCNISYLELMAAFELRRPITLRGMTGVIDSIQIESGATPAKHFNITFVGGSPFYIKID